MRYPFLLSALCVVGLAFAADEAPPAPGGPEHRHPPGTPIEFSAVPAAAQAAITAKADGATIKKVMQITGKDGKVVYVALVAGADGKRGRPIAVDATGAAVQPPGHGPHGPHEKKEGAPSPAPANP